MDQYLPLQQGTVSAINGTVQLQNSNGDPSTLQFTKTGENANTATISYDGLIITSDTTIQAPIISSQSFRSPLGDYTYTDSTGQQYSVKTQLNTIQSILAEYDIDINQTQGYISALQNQADTLTSQMGSTVAQPISSGLQTQITAQGTIIDTNTQDIVTLNSDMTTAETNITSLAGNMTTTNGNVTTLQGQMTTVQGNVTTLQGDLTTTNGNVTTLQGQMTTVQGDLTTLQNNLTTTNGNITSLSTNLGTNYSTTTQTTGLIANAVTSSNGYTDTSIQGLNISQYVTSTSADAVYQKISDMTNYYTKTSADAKFGTITQINGLQTQINQLITGDVQYEGVFVDNTYGNDTTGTGVASNPWKTIQKALDSKATTFVVYVKSSTTQNVTFNSNNQSIQIIFDPKTQHSGLFTLVPGNTYIYFLTQTAWMNGGIVDGSTGSIYYNCTVSGSYTKNASSSGTTPIGYVEFGCNSCIDGLIVNMSANSMIRTLGTGAMGPIEQSNGMLILQHSGSVNGASPNTAPIHITSGNPLLGVPITMIQGQIQLISPYTAYALYSQATYGYLFCIQVSTLQQDLSTYKFIQASGSATYYSKVWANCDCGLNINTYNPVLTTHATYIKADYPSPVNWAINSVDQLPTHLSGIDTKIGTMNTTINGHTTNIGTNTTAINTANTNITNLQILTSNHTTEIGQNTTGLALVQSQMASTAASKVNSGLQGQISDLQTFQSSVPGVYQTISAMSSYLTSATASSTYATVASLGTANSNISNLQTFQNTTVPATYQTISGMSSYLTAVTAASTYQPLGTYVVPGDLNAYLTSATASSTYQTISGMSSYLTSATASSTYQPKGTYVVPGDLNAYLTTSTASSTYQTQSAMSSYLTSSTAASTYQPKGTYVVPGDLNAYLTTSTASSTYQTQSAMSSYLTSATASSTYQTQSAMSSYLTSSTAASTYQPKGTYVVPGDLNAYLTTSTASSTYQTQSAMSSYLTSSTAASTYQTQSAMSSYLTSATASSTYATITNLGTANTNITALQTATTGIANVSSTYTQINRTLELYASAGGVLRFKDGSGNTANLTWTTPSIVCDKTLDAAFGYKWNGNTMYQTFRGGPSNSNFIANGYIGNIQASMGGGNTIMGFNCGAYNTYDTGTIGNTLYGRGISLLGTAPSENTAIGDSISFQTDSIGCTYIGQQISGQGTRGECVISTGNGLVQGLGNNTFYIRATSGVYNSQNSANWSTTSDQRIKKDITLNTTYTLDKLMQLQLKDYNYKTKTEEPVLVKNEMPVYPNKETGLIAQEVQNVFSDAVLVPEDMNVQTLSIDYHYINMLVLAGLQQLKRQVDGQVEFEQIGDVIIAKNGLNGTQRNGHTLLKCDGSMFNGSTYQDLQVALGGTSLPYLQVMYPTGGGSYGVNGQLSYYVIAN